MILEIRTDAGEMFECLYTYFIQDGSIADSFDMICLVGIDVAEDTLPDSSRRWGVCTDPAERMTSFPALAVKTVFEEVPGLTLTKEMLEAFKRPFEVLDEKLILVACKYRYMFSFVVWRRCGMSVFT